LKVSDGRFKCETLKHA